jgi:hypothetical protein
MENRLRCRHIDCTLEYSRSDSRLRHERSKHNCVVNICEGCKLVDEWKKRKINETCPQMKEVKKPKVEKRNESREYVSA